MSRHPELERRVRRVENDVESLYELLTTADGENRLARIESRLENQGAQLDRTIQLLENR